MQTKIGIFIIFTGLLAVLLFAFRVPGFAADLPFMGEPPSRLLVLHNLHTGEDMQIDYRGGFRYNPIGMAKLDRFMRDHRTGHVHEIDGDLLGLLNGLKIVLEDRHPGAKIRFDVISGYRSRETNEMLRKAGGAQAKESHHIDGKAIDIRVPGISLKELRDAAWCMGRGGVGYYAEGNFVHVDTGRVRYWNWTPDSGMCRRNDGFNH